ncbi:MAG: Antitoxin VapB10 [Acidimicrobiales bacterium]|nr:Antitoxin VapB10 [Acidimicrobiales bacterium]
MAGETASAAIYTTGSWYYRLASAAENRSGTGSMSRRIAALSEDDQRDVRAQLDSLPNAVGLLGPRKLVGTYATVDLAGRAVYSCCMAAIRTQIYLTEDQRSRIDRAADADGVTMAEIIRRAVDDYLDHEANPAIALAATFGADRGAEVPSRDSWRRG